MVVLCRCLVVFAVLVLLAAAVAADAAAAAPKVRRWVRVPRSGGHVRLLPLLPACLLFGRRSWPLSVVVSSFRFLCCPACCCSAVPATVAPKVRRWVRVPRSGGHVRLLPLLPACLFLSVGLGLCLLLCLLFVVSVVLLAVVCLSFQFQALGWPYYCLSSWFSCAIVFG